MGTRATAAFFLFVISAFAGKEFDPNPPEPVRPSELLVGFKRGADSRGAVASLPGAAITGSVSNSISVVTVPPNSRAAASKHFANHPLVEFVEPNRIRRAVGISPDDPSFASQYALQLTQAAAAWSSLPGRFFASSPVRTGRIRVAVLDTGADCTHPDFKNPGGASTDSASGGQLNWALSRAFEPTTIPGAACPWQDDHWHGTHTAGTVAAATNNGGGVSSLGYPVEVMVMKVLDSAGSGDDATISTAVRAAADAGANVISMSLGGAGYSQTFQSAINYAWSKNVLVVSAAGNDNSGALFFPAGANHSFAVAATDSVDARASFSNYGSSVDIAAPGVNILSTYPVYMTSPGSQPYVSASGTSMATPHVAALAGLVSLTTPGVSPDAVMQRIQQSADSTTANGGWNQGIGYGRINAAKAVTGSLRASGLGSVVGQVVDSRDLPIGNALVSIGGQNFITDDTGLFRFANLSPGAYTISASVSGFATQSFALNVLAGADTTATIPVGIGLGTYTGTVTSGGVGIAGAIVEAIQGGTVEAAAVSGPGGLYSLPVPAGTYSITVSAIGRGLSTMAAPAIAAGSTATVNATLPKLGTVAGTVRDASNAVIAGAQVLVSGANYSAGAVTDVTGAFSTPGLPPGAYTVTASKAGYPDSPPATVSIAPDTTASVNLQLSSSTSAVSGVTLASSSAGGGNTVQMTVTLNAPAAGAGAIVTLSSSNPAVASVPPTVMVAPGMTTASTAVTTSTVTATTSVTITGSLGGSTKSAALSVYPIALSALTLSPTSIQAGKSTTANHVTLNTIAPAAGVPVTLTSSDASVTVPARVTVPANTTSAAFTIGTSQIATTKTVTITAAYGGVSKAATLTVTPAGIGISALSISPTTIAGGNSITTATVTVSTAAPAGGLAVSLASSNSAVASLPQSSVTIAEGATVSPKFTVKTAWVTSAATAVITATSGASSKSVTLTVNPASVAALSISPTTLAGGNSISTATVVINAPAPTGGAVIHLVSSNSAVASLPQAAVTIAAGTTVSPKFTVNTSSVSAQKTVGITASLGSSSKAVTLTVNPTALLSMYLYQASVAGGNTVANSYVTLDSPAPAGGATVTLASNNPAAAPQASVTVAAGAAKSALFTIATSPVSAQTVTVISATYGGVTRSANLTIRPGALSYFSVSTTSVGGGNAIGIATVKLDSPAPATGATVTFTSSSPAIPTPAPVPIPAGSTTSANFAIPTAPVAVSTTVTLAATYGGVTKAVSITVYPIAPNVLTLSPATVAGGISTSYNHVSLNTIAPAGGVAIALTSSNPAVVVPRSVAVAAGMTSSPNFAIATSHVAVPTTVTISATYNGVTKAANLTVNP